LLFPRGGRCGVLRVAPGVMASGGALAARLAVRAPRSPAAWLARCLPAPGSPAPWSRACCPRVRQSGTSASRLAVPAPCGATPLPRALLCPRPAVRHLCLAPCCARALRCDTSASRLAVPAPCGRHLCLAPCFPLHAGGLDALGRPQASLAKIQVLREPAPMLCLRISPVARHLFYPLHPPRPAGGASVNHWRTSRSRQRGWRTSFAALFTRTVRSVASLVSPPLLYPLHRRARPVAPLLIPGGHHARGSGAGGRRSLPCSRGRFDRLPRSSARRHGGRCSYSPGFSRGW
jgi:hypothetical protein